MSNEKRWLAYKGSKYEDPEYFDGDFIVLSLCSTVRERLGGNVPVFLREKKKEEGEIIVFRTSR